MLLLLLTGAQVMLFQMGLVQGYQCDKEYRVIKVASRFNKSCTPSEPITECKTLQDVVTNIKSLNETCIEIYNNQNLTESIRFKYVSGLTLLKASNISEVVVDCDTDTRCGQNGTGISFRNSSNIKIYGLKFERCGIKQKTDLCAEKQNLVFYISSAFHFDYITNVTFEGVQLFKSHGYSVHMFNSGSQLRFHKVTVKDGIFVRNCYSDCHAEVIGSRSGGGIQIVFGGSSAFSRENQVEISSSNFQNNIAELNDRNFSCNFTKAYFPFGRGGALSIIFNGDSKNNDVVVTSSSFTNNSALWGGSIHFKFDDHSQYNDVQVRSVSIDSSNGSLYGGGILAWGVNNENNNNFNVSETNFYGNNASLGGGLAIMGLKGEGKYATVMNCFFEDNAASFGAGIFIKDTKATLDTVNVSQNNNQSMEVYSQTFNGAIASFNSTVNIHGDSFIEKNINTGFLLDQTELHIKGHLNLHENSGFDGGGMAVYGNSHIKTCKNSTLYFANNKASNRGGGLFVMVPGPYIKPLNIMLSRYDCFIENNNGAVDGNISFVNNTASNEYGKAIFVSTLQHCTRGMNDFETVFTNWTNFYFRPDNDSHNVVTEPSTMKLNMDEWTPAPGIPFQPSVFLYDERGTNVAETVDVTLEPENITTSTLNKKFVIDDNKINIAFKGNKSINFSAVIVATNSEVLPHNITNITFKECPFGFYYNDQDKLCQCGRPHDFSKGIAQCAQSDIYVFKNRWVYKNASYECPSGYCIDCQDDTITGFECKLNIAKQCNEARNQTSRLCSRCNDNFSVTIGSNMCSSCKGTKWWSLILVYLTIFIVATILFLVCNFNGYACYLNSAVFFYKCAGTVMEPVKVYYIDPAMTHWLTLLSETFESRKVGFCFIDGLNNLDKLGFTFGKPGLFILPIVIVIIILKCTNRRWKFFNMDACKRSINNILIIFWMGIIIAILQTLHPVSIDGTKYVFVYADEVYLGKNHIRYFVVAIIMIFAAVGFLLCTIFYEKFYTHLIGRFRIVVYILSFLIYAIICIYVPTDIRVTLASIFCLIMVSVILLLPSNTADQERDSATNDSNEEDDDHLQLIQSNENNRNEKLLNGLELTHLSMLTLLVLLYGSMEGLYCPLIAEKKIAHPCRIISISINILLYLPLATSAFYCVYNLYLKDTIAAICKKRRDATGILVILCTRPLTFSAWCLLNGNHA